MTTSTCRRVINKKHDATNRTKKYKLQGRLLNQPGEEYEGLPMYLSSKNKPLKVIMIDATIRCTQCSSIIAKQYRCYAIAPAKININKQIFHAIMLFATQLVMLFTAKFFS